VPQEADMTQKTSDSATMTGAIFFFPTSARATQGMILKYPYSCRRKPGSIAGKGTKKSVHKLASLYETPIFSCVFRQKKGKETN